MKSRMTIALISMIFALGIIVSGFLLANRDNITQASSTATQVVDNTNAITVQGEGIIKQAPDIAYISIGVQTKYSKVETAQKENTKKFNNVVEEIKKQGVDKSDIKTEDYSVYPSYSDNSKINGYVVSNTVSVTVRDISKCGKIIDAVMNKDANIINGITFAIDNKSKSYNEALKSAINDAKSKAKAIADSIGNVSIHLINVKEQNVQSDPIYYAADNAKMAAQDMAGTSINGGKSEVKADVTVVFEIK